MQWYSTPFAEIYELEISTNMISSTWVSVFSIVMLQSVILVSLLELRIFVLMVTSVGNNFIKSACLSVNQERIDGGGIPKRLSE